MCHDAYKKSASRYDRWLGPLLNDLRRIGLKMYPPRAGMRVLDVGCGTGTGLLLYQQNGCRVYGIDKSPAMLTVAKNRLGHLSDLRLSNAAKMPYPDDSFDKIIAMLTLHEISGQLRLPVIREMNRVVKKTGKILLIDYHSGPLRFPGGWISRFIILLFEVGAGGEHYRNYRHFIYHQGVQRLAETAGLTVEKQKLVAGGNIGLWLIHPVKDERVDQS